LDKIRFGMIGAGESKCHLPCLQNRDDATVTAIANLNEDRARSQAKKMGFPLSPPIAGI